MARDGSNIYNLPFPPVVSGTTISSGVYNGFTSDMALEQNNPRPVLSGGTGAASADAALFNLAAMKAAQLVTNYDAQVWMPGTFYSATTATGEPVDGHAFSGVAYIGEALANPPTNQNVTLEARDVTDGKLYVRRKTAGSWGSWTLESDPAGGLYVNKAGDTMTGMLTLPATTPSTGNHATNKTYVDAADALKANLASPAFTGNPTAPNPPGGDNDTSVATTAFVTSVAVRYDMAQSLTAANQTQARANISAALRGHIWGLGLSMTGTSSTFVTAAGEASNSTGVDLMVLSGGLNKTTAAWAVGNNNGGLDTGTIATNTWYYPYLIKRPDTGVVDVVISLSPSAPTLPTNYTVFRRIGALRLNAVSGGQWVKLIQVDDTFMWDVPVLDLNGVNVSAGVSATLLIPNVLVDAIFHMALNSTVASAFMVVHSPLITPQTIGVPTTNYQILNPIAGVTDPSSVMRLPTNSQTLRLVSGTGSGGTQLAYLITHGWVDTRNRFG